MEQKQEHVAIREPCHSKIPPFWAQGDQVSPRDSESVMISEANSVAEIEKKLTLRRRLNGGESVSWRVFQ